MSWWEESARPIIQSPEVAGALGSLMSLKWVPGRDWAGRFFAFGTGFGIALFVAPLLIEVLKVHSKFGPPAFGFLAGLLGMNITAKAIDMVKTADWFAVVSAVWGRRP